MSVPAIEAEIYSRLDGDSTLTALLGGTANQEIFNTLAPESARFPFVVFVVTGEQQEDTFETDEVTMTVAVAVYGAWPADYTACASIVDRIYGDAVDQSDRVPTYGLHRWSMGTVSGDTSWTASEMRRLSSQTQHTDEALVYVDTYEVSLSKGG